VDEAAAPSSYNYRPIPRRSSFLAARAHAAYRSRGGTRQRILSDVLIGAHAVIERCELLTRECPGLSERRSCAAGSSKSDIQPAQGNHEVAFTPSSGCNSKDSYCISRPSSVD